MNSLAPSETVQKFPVVMLYDHFSSVGVAMATYSHLTRELENDFKPELRAWRMDAATSSEFSAKANADIAEAEVIIVSVRANERWPAAFQHWKSGQVQPGTAASPHAIIVLLESPDGPPASNRSWNSMLRSAATQIHPEVFVYEDETAPAEQPAEPVCP